MWKWIDYLKDPYLVLEVQKFFGVYPVIDKNLKKQFKNSSNGNLVQSRKKDNNSAITNSGSLNKNSDDTESAITSGSDTETKDYVVTNKFWYYLFVFGTELGDEIFYASFIPFWFWNIDGAVGRRVVMVWTLIMCIGKWIKDIVCWPRPASPPVFRLQQKWALEYGMPSTHAMVGISIPFSVVIYTIQRYEAICIGLIVAVLWCTVISVSRLYLGMHTVLDIIVGLVLASILMVPIVPLVDRMDSFILTSQWSPFLLICISIAIIAFYPKSSIWTPTRQDTTMVVSVCIGVHIGAWTNYQLGIMSEAQTSPPYSVIWPSYEMLGLALLRVAIGFSCILATRAVCKSASYATLCFLLRLNSSDLRRTAHTGPSSAKNTVELCYKYITYASMGFNTLYLLPSVFSLLSIHRPSFYTEI
uniref:AcidPPc domain-containing protein n=1 Tax=Rhodnius prolixus TaxID=13249 RepID=T1I6Q3_RHOPR